MYSFYGDESGSLWKSKEDEFTVTQQESESVDSEINNDENTESEDSQINKDENTESKDSGIKKRKTQIQRIHP